MIETQHRIEPALDLEDEGLRVHRPFGNVVSELRLEQLHQQHGDRRVRRGDLLDVVLTEGGADLAHVARVGADERRLLPAESGAHDEGIEVVDLALTRPRGSETLLEALAQAFRPRDLPARQGQPEVEDPGLLTIGATDLVRILIENLNTHALQDRQQAR